MVNLKELVIGGTIYVAQKLENTTVVQWETLKCSVVSKGEYAVFVLSDGGKILRLEVAAEGWIDKASFSEDGLRIWHQKNDSASSPATEKKETVEPPAKPEATLSFCSQGWYVKLEQAGRWNGEYLQMDADWLMGDAYYMATKEEAIELMKKAGLSEYWENVPASHKCVKIANLSLTKAFDDFCLHNDANFFDMRRMRHAPHWFRVVEVTYEHDGSVFHTGDKILVSDGYITNVTHGFTYDPLEDDRSTRVNGFYSLIKWPLGRCLWTTIFVEQISAEEALGK